MRKKKRVKINSYISAPGSDERIPVGVVEIKITESKELKRYLENGCTHDYKNSPIEGVCRNCAEKFWRKCYTEIKWPGQYDSCKTYFLPKSRTEKFCSVCYEKVNKGFRYE